MLKMLNLTMLGALVSSSTEPPTDNSTQASPTRRPAIDPRDAVSMIRKYLAFDLDTANMPAECGRYIKEHHFTDPLAQVEKDIGVLAEMVNYTAAQREQLIEASNKKDRAVGEFLDAMRRGTLSVTELNEKDSLSEETELFLSTIHPYVEEWYYTLLNTISGYSRAFEGSAVVE